MSEVVLVDPATPGTSPCALRSVPSRGADVLVLGSDADDALARRAGLRPAGRIGVPMRRPALAWRSLRRWLLARQRAGRTDRRLHAVSIEAAHAAALAAPDVPRTLMLGVGPADGWLAALARRSVGRGAGLESVTYESEAVRAAWRDAGLPDGAVASPPCHRRDVAPGARRSLRAAWGVGEDTFVIGLMTAPAAWGDARRAAGLAGRLEASGRRILLVVHPEAARCRDAATWLARLGLSDLLRVDPVLAEPWQALPALDAVLTIHDPGRVRTPGDAPVHWARAAGVPLASEGEAAEVTRRLASLCDARA